MTADGSGIIDTIKYWCDGSPHKVVELVLAQIREFKLKGRVVAALGLEQSETKDHIISQLKAALGCLKECRTEDQRQEYRMAITMVAPSADGTRFSRGDYAIAVKW